MDETFTVGERKGDMSNGVAEDVLKQREAAKYRRALEDLFRSADDVELSRGCGHPNWITKPLLTTTYRVCAECGVDEKEIV